ncbi:MAG: hypothetical protein J6W06_05440 [Bacteroidales bacterium]|nr:hypothetical protein [Bacteroidales bacterium]
MEKKFDSLTIFEFEQQFHDDEACLKYFSKLKWANCFVCLQWHTHYCSHTKASRMSYNVPRASIYSPRSQGHSSTS